MDLQTYLIKPLVDELFDILIMDGFMIAGRELDKMVAEKVMGNLTSDEPVWQRTYNLPDGLCETTRDRVLRRTLPNYSTDIAAAWEVVNRIHADTKLVFQLAAPQQDYVNEKWRANFNKKWWLDESPYYYEVDADTAPLAICLAALKAKGVRV
jgi:hypothetical protein